MRRVHVIRIGLELCCHSELSLYQRNGIKALDLIELRDPLQPTKTMKEEAFRVTW